MTSVLTFRPFVLDPQLAELRFDLIESGLDKEYFHAAEDEQATRDRVFGAIGTRLNAFRADSVVVEKRKTSPSLRENDRFYPSILGYLLRYVVNGSETETWQELIVITDKLPVQKKRKAVEKAIKTTLQQMLPKAVRFRILHHDSKSCLGLQVADYFNWAIYRKWDRENARSHVSVRPAIRSEFDIFRNGTKIWY